MSELLTDPQYRAGNIDADLEYYRIHFASTLREREELDRLISRLRSAFTSAGIVAARAIEDRLYAQTWDADDYDLRPRLNQLDIPTLIIHGDNDLVPTDVAREIADAIPEARFVVLADCGHFSYLEQTDRVPRPSPHSWPPREPVSGARPALSQPAVAYASAIQLPWKPNGTRCGRCTVATGAVVKSWASRMT